MAFDAYMPVMLAVMEIPGCLVALYLVARLRHRGWTRLGNMPDEPGYTTRAGAGPLPGQRARPRTASTLDDRARARNRAGAGALAGEAASTPSATASASRQEAEPMLSRKLLHEVFLNPGLYLLFGGIVIGFISGLQGEKVTRDDDNFFVDLFQGVLCLFLLEMGMTASRKLKDLRTAGWRFIVFGLLAPNLFATIGHHRRPHLRLPDRTPTSSWAPTSCSRCSAARRRTSPCRRCSGWRSPRRARRCPWRRRWA